MDEHAELLVQQFLDGELDRAGRGTLLRLLGDDPGMRQRLLADEEMLAVAANLPRVAAPPDFVARTMARLPAIHAEDAPAPVADAQPRTAAYRWMPAAAAAAVVLLASGFWVGRLSAPEPARTAGVATSESANQEILVRLVLIEPSAQSVAIVGDFNGWDPMRSPLQRANGVWSTTLTLPPGRYNYLFLVDGDRWMADPLAVETSMDGFGAENSVLDLGA